MALAAGSAHAGPCDRLDAGQRAAARKLQSTTHPHDCCDETLSRCLKQRRVCRLATRLRDQICRLLLRGKSPKAIKDALERRARSMTPLGKKARIDLSAAGPAGDARARTVVVVYACARCPLCAKVVPRLHRLVTAGPLRGKVRLHFRPFPIRGHEGAVLGGLAMVAAEQQRRPWPFILRLYAGGDGFGADKLVRWAGEAGLDTAAFKRALGDKATRRALVSAKKEGLRNGVKATPTLFIDGLRYHGDLDRDTLEDVLGEAADRGAKRRYTAK